MAPTHCNSLRLGRRPDPYLAYPEQNIRAALRSTLGTHCHIWNKNYKHNQRQRQRGSSKQAHRLPRAFRLMPHQVHILEMNDDRTDSRCLVWPRLRIV